MSLVSKWVRRSGVAAASVGLLLAAPAGAQVPRPWEWYFQPPGSPVQESIGGLYSFINWMMVAIVVFVMALIAVVLVRFNAKRHPVASKVSHHTTLEIAWTLLPVLILVAMVIPSFRLVYYEDRTPDADMTLKVTGHQWYWEYTYPDQGGFTFNSNMIHDEDLKAGDIRRLAVDNEMVVPAGRNIRILTTSGDVIHSFFIPSLGVQRYAIPGRTIETWVRVNAPGDYYGQCNQICGELHSGMPIHVHALSDADFKTWTEQAKVKFAAGEAPGNPAREGRVAVAQAAP